MIYMILLALYNADKFWNYKFENYFSNVRILEYRYLKAIPKIESKTIAIDRLNSPPKKGFCISNTI